MITTNNGTKFYIGNKEVNAMYQGENLVYSGMSKDAIILFSATTGINTIHMRTTENGGENDCTIDWGDGSKTIAPVGGGNVTHNYIEGKEYTIKISGTKFMGFYVNNQSEKEKYTSLISMGVWENITTMAKAFYGCNNIGLKDGAVFNGLPNLTDVALTFLNSGLSSLPAELFKNNPMIESFDYTFSGCSISKIPEGLFDSCIEALSFKNTFSGQNSSGTDVIPAGLFRYNTKATMFSGTFEASTHGIQIPPGLFDTNVLAETFDSVFQNCFAVGDNLGLNSIPPDLFKYNTVAKNFKRAFSGCSSLIAIPQDLFKTNILAETFAYAFEDCSALVTIPEGLFEFNINAKDFSAIFYENYALTSVPPDLFRYNILAESFSYAFYECRNLTLRTDLFGTNYATRFNGRTVNFGNMFERASCDLLAQVQGVAPELWNFAGLSAVKTNCFDGNGNSKVSISNFASIPLEWGGFPSVINASVVLNATAGANTLHIRTAVNGNYGIIDWGDGTKDILPMNGGNVIHSYASAGLKTISIIGPRFSGFYVNNQTGKEKYTAINSLGNWKQKVMTSLSYAFYRCTGLTSIAEDAFRYVTETTNFQNIFDGCTALTTLPPNMFAYNLSATNFDRIFSGCNASVLRADIFGTDYLSRFNGKTVSFSYSFSRTTFGIPTQMSVAPEIWAFNGLTPLTCSMCFEGNGNSKVSITNYASIPEAWGSFQTIDASILFAATAGANTLHLRTIGAGYYCLIDWGDGTTSVCPSGGGNVVHNYTVAGDYTIKFVGASFNGFYVNNQTGKEKYKKLYSYGKYASSGMSVLSFMGAFYGCTALSTVWADATMYQTAVVTAEYMFSGCTSLGSIPADLFKYNTKITTFQYAFRGCTALTSIPADIFRYTTKVTLFGYLFEGCTNITSIPVDIFRYCPDVTEFTSVFSGLSNMTSIDATIFMYNTKVTVLRSAFNGWSKLTAIPVDIFRYNTLALDLRYVFLGASLITTIPAGIFMYNTQATAFAGVFKNCAKISAIPTDLFRYNTLVTNFAEAFYGASLITTIPANIFMYNTKVTSFAYLFYSCVKINSLPVDLFRYNTLVTDMSYVFYQCSLITSFSVDLFRYNTEITNFSGVFMACGGISSVPAEIFKYNTKVTSFWYAFWNSAITSIPTDLFRYNTLVTTFGFAFRACFQLTSVGDNLFLYNILATNFTYAFDGCTRIQLKSNMFGTDYATRFAGKTVDFSYFVNRTSFLGTQGTTPLLWSFTYGAITSTLCFGGAGNSATSISNYASIPAGWK